MYKFFVILLLSFVLSTSAIATSLTFDGDSGRASFFATQAAEGSVVQLTFKGQDIDSEFFKKLEGFFKNQQSITSLVFDGCDFRMSDFHYLTHLGELESFTMTNCSVDPEMARVVLANLDGYTVNSINLSGNPLLNAASKSIVGGKFAGTITWGDGTSAFEVTSAHAIASEPSTPRRVEDDQSPKTATATPIRPPQPLTQPSSTKKRDDSDDEDDDVAKAVDPLRYPPPIDFGGK